MARYCSFVPCLHCLRQKTSISVEFVPLARREIFALVKIFGFLARIDENSLIIARVKFCDSCQ